MRTRTAAEAKAELERKGISISAWARANNLSGQVVHQVLAGTVKGTRGEAHRAAVLLGMKQGEVVPADCVKNALVLNKATATA